MRFQDRVILVCGAASGMGRATTELLVAEGATVVAADRDDDGLAGLSERCFYFCLLQDFSIQL